MIVVEGPDGAGKTTLINHLAHATDLPVAPRVVSKDAEAMVDLKKWTEDNIARGFQNIIYDRHRLFSEPVYGPILRDKPQPGFDDLNWFYEQLAGFYNLGPLVIYCLPPFKTVYENVKDDPDNKVVSGGRQIRAIYGAYVNKATTEQVLYRNSFVYDYTDEVTAKMLRQFFVGRIKEMTG